MKRSGFNHEYRMKLHQCLREKLIFIVNERNKEIKLRLLRKCYEWFLQKLISMGALSQQEIDNENAFLNPMSKQLASMMRSIVKHKVHSALCNEEMYAAHDKAQYLGPKRGEFDKETEEYYEVHDHERAARTAHPDIQPASVRIKNYRHKTFGKKFDQAVDAVKARDSQLSGLKKESSWHGLMTAKLGSVYDVPSNSSQLDERSTMASTMRVSKMSEQSKMFGETEGAKYKPAFKAFYTNAEQEVKYTSTNKFEGVSSYFSYYPTDDIRE